MSSYVNKNLMPDEEVIKNAKVHWFVFVPGLLLILIPLILIVVFSKEGTNLFTAILPLLIVYGIYKLVIALFWYIGTELSITSKRVIAKYGFIRRHTTELNHKNVESFSVDQSVFGRLLNFGTVHVNGVGGVATPIRAIAEPLDFRKVALSKIEETSTQ